MCMCICMCVYVYVCVCVFIKLHITAQSGSVILFSHSMPLALGGSMILVTKTSEGCVVCVTARRVSRPSTSGTRGEWQNATQQLRQAKYGGVFRYIVCYAMWDMITGMADLVPASSSPPQQPLAHGNIKHGAFEKDLCHKPSKNLAYISGVARVLLEKTKTGTYDHLIPGVFCTTTKCTTIKKTGVNSLFSDSSNLGTHQYILTPTLQPQLRFTTARYRTVQYIHCKRRDCDARASNLTVIFKLLIILILLIGRYGELRFPASHATLLLY